MHTFLSQTAEYALRAMAWIAAHPTGGPVLARELSQGTGIPAQYLAKILRRLVLAGILVSRKGRGGGFTLSRPAERIRFRDVLAAVDAYPLEDRCAFGWGACDPAHPCPLHDSWGGMSGRFRAWATRTTFKGMKAGRGGPRAGAGSRGGA
jgi:Rrf2 family iron-sulfur cluster assembly transcriptional regulator